MKVPRHTIASTLTKMSRQKSNKRQLAYEVAAYLLSEHRTQELEPLMRDVIEERTKDGVVEVKAVSAHPLKPGLTADIKREVERLYPNAHEIIVSPSLDPSLVGGLRLEFANSQLDLSLRAKLNRLKNQITYGKDNVSA